MIKIDRAIFILPLYVDFTNRDGIDRHNEMISVQLSEHGIAQVIP